MPRPQPEGHADLSAKWVGAGHLKVGDQIKQADGTVGVIANVATVQQTQEMFNLTVSEAHTYYVGQDGWLVHNGCGEDKALEIADHALSKHVFQQGDLKRLGISTREDLSKVIQSGIERAKSSSLGDKVAKLDSRANVAGTIFKPNNGFKGFTDLINQSTRRGIKK